jgi:hypothetical protein
MFHGWDKQTFSNPCFSLTATDQVSHTPETTPVLQLRLVCNFGLLLSSLRTRALFPKDLSAACTLLLYSNDETWKYVFSTLTKYVVCTLYFFHHPIHCHSATSAAVILRLGVSVCGYTYASSCPGYRDDTSPPEPTRSFPTDLCLPADAREWTTCTRELLRDTAHY